MQATRRSLFHKRNRNGVEVCGIFGLLPWRVIPAEHFQLLSIASVTEDYFHRQRPRAAGMIGLDDQPRGRDAPESVGLHVGLADF